MVGMGVKTQVLPSPYPTLAVPVLAFNRPLQPLLPLVGPV